MSERRRLNEFELIERLFAPLAAGTPGALGLADDAGLLDGGPAGDLVVTADCMVAGVHFPTDDPADLIARKLLRVNLSDLAAMGARPEAYMLTVILPAAVELEWLEAFAAGLAADQSEFGIGLLGGDTVAAPGPLGLSLTAFGRVAGGRALRRAGAKPGDRVWVSGTIGDGTLGLAALKGRIGGLSGKEREVLVDRYRLPRPRLALGAGLVGLARAAVDVSDGLVADLGHICRASGVDASVRWDRVPLSQAARAAVALDPALREAVLTGGDDYEVLFTAAPDRDDAVAALGKALGVPLGRIGAIEPSADGGGRVRVFDGEGREIPLTDGGYRHF